MAYKAKATRNDDGSYALSFGKGGKKLTAKLVHDETSQRWGTEAGETFKTKREAVAAWEAWATSVYGGTSAPASSGQTATSQRDVPPAPHSGPPKYVRPDTTPIKPAARVDHIAASYQTIATPDADGTYRLGKPPMTFLPADRYALKPCTGGYAIIERETGTQVGGTYKSLSRCQAEVEKLNYPTETHVKETNSGGAGEDAERDGTEADDAPAAQDAATGSPAGQEQAPAAVDRPAVHAPLPPIPRRPRPVPAVPQSGGAAQPAE